MSLRIATSEHMLSTIDGIGMNRNWAPRVVAEAFLESTKDGEIQRAPDPVTMIEGSLSWFNNSNIQQSVSVAVHRGPRSVVSTSPVTVIILDAWSWQVGTTPQAEYPSLDQSQSGGRLQIDRPEVAPADLLFGRYFLDSDDNQEMVNLGIIKPMKSFHFRYLCSVQTPGVWTRPSEFDARYEATAHWARLVALAWPDLTTPAATGPKP